MSFKETWGCWLTFVGFILVVVILVKFGWDQIACAVFAILAAILFFWFLIDERLQKRKYRQQGFSVVPLTGGQLGETEKEWAVEYVEYVEYREGVAMSSARYTFYGKVFPKNNHVLFVPSEATWPRAVPAELKEKRDLILSRIREELDRRKYYKDRYTIEDIEASSPER